MQLIIAFFLISTFPCWSASEIEEAKASVRALMGPILQKAKSGEKPALPKGFSLESCEKHKINWMDVLLQKETATLVYTFKTGCDIEGKLKPAVLKPFAADFKLKNMEHFTRLEASNRITSSFDSMPVLNLAMRSGVLSGKKGKVLFEADYAVKINPLMKSKPVEENMGGEIRISEIFGKKVSITEKVKVD